jgi:hypothetical protein
MPKFQYVEAVFGQRVIEVRAPNQDAADKLYQKHGASSDSRDCRVISTKYHDSFLTEIRDESGKVLEDLLPPDNEELTDGVEHESIVFDGEPVVQAGTDAEAVSEVTATDAAAV